MNSLSYTKEQILDAIKEACKTAVEQNTRILFLPNEINDKNFRQVCEVYASIYPHNFDTIVILEGVDRELKKGICIPDLESFKTPFGSVPVNTRLADDFCDEEDDFYITNESYHEGLSLFQQLQMLQVVQSGYSVVSIQVSNQESSSILRELSIVMSDVLTAYNSLTICCCDMHIDQKDKLDLLMNYHVARDTSNLKYLINQEDVLVHGKSPLLTGMLLAQIWDLDIQFLDGTYSTTDGNSLIAGYAVNKRGL
ncbi:MAG TPA: AmmeMemoRadiSam system protein B [Balneolales bacterium]|nr:AmmeMemoRadiSam system protein B [Balneolales bacterium]